MTMRNTNSFVFVIAILVSLSCNISSRKEPAPGSLEERIAEGNIRLEGSGNVTYIGCQDPTAAVSVHIGEKLWKLDGVALSDHVNLVTVNAITDGTQIRLEECGKTSLGERYDWPARGIYYPKDERISFTTCTQNNDKAEGEAFLVGEGFEGEYACFDKDDGDLIFEVAFSAYSIVE